MKTVTRVAALLTAIMLCFTTGCSQKATSSDSSEALPDSAQGSSVTENGSNEANQGDNGGQKGFVRQTPNLGGKTYKIAVWDTDKLENGSYNGFPNASKAYHSAIDKVKKELNCKFEFVVADSSQLTNNIITNVAAGASDYADIVFPVLWNTSPLIAYLTDLNSVKTIDLTADYWNQPMTDIGRVNGKAYFGSNSMCNVLSTETVCVYFNKKMISELGLTSPYELVENNQWTLSKFREYCLKATKDSDGKTGMTENDNWGVTCQDFPTGFTSYIAAANNAKFIKKDANGFFVYNMDSTNVVSSLRYTQDWITNDKSLYYSQDQEQNRKMFKTGKTLFYLNWLHESMKLDDMTDDYGVVPFPRGDAQKKYYSNIHWSTQVVAVPKTITGSRLEEVGAILQSMAYYSKDIETAKLNDVKNLHMRDEESGKMIDNYIKTAGVIDPALLAACPANIELQRATLQLSTHVSDVAVNIATAISEKKSQAEELLKQYNNVIK